MRDGLRQIISGWMLVDDFDALSDRIERAAVWTDANKPLLPDEAATVKLMVECQIAQGMERHGFAGPQITSIR
jgi:hypothetical protein